MTINNMVSECDSKRIVGVTLYKPKRSLAAQTSKTWRLPAYHFIFIVGYIYQIYWMATTIGIPYQEFIHKAEQEGFEVMEGAAKMRAELKHSLQDIHDEQRTTGKVGWFDWMNMDIEEHVERKKRESQKSVLDALPKHMRVPNKYYPTFWSMLVTGIIATLHALVVLMQHWLVGFNVWLNYVPIKDMSTVEANLPEDEEYLVWNNTNNDDDPVTDGNDKSASSSKTLKQKKPNHVYHPAELSFEDVMTRNLPTEARIRPLKGKDVLVPLVYLPTMGVTFEYHRRRFVWSSDDQVWKKVRCETKMPLEFFNKWSGYTNLTHQRAAQLRYGPNLFDVKQPTFTELYKAQLLSPFTVFQLFCVLLWMLDEYWYYSLFTLFMILTFEATVVFSRIKNLGALKGMGNRPRRVWVYRYGSWTTVLSDSLLPGDIFSLTRHKPKQITSEGGAMTTSVIQDQDGDIVPADLLLMQGHAVVSEASLTGESVPQMKDGLSEMEVGAILEMKGKHKSQVLYAGTKLLQCQGETNDSETSETDETESTTANSGSKNNSDVVWYSSSVDTPPPDGGCLCFVLRTGFSSAQGKLVRMIEGSQEKVKGHEKETGLLLLMLFFFACASSGYVLHHGMQSGQNRSRYELLLHCILIITSVIPPELPMQMALAVNNSLITLMKMQVFCTEPFRVPMAGKLDCCLFDKTGTLTTDELVAVGVSFISSNSGSSSDAVVDTNNTTSTGHRGKRHPSSSSTTTSTGPSLTSMTKLNNEAGLVLAGCHSLVYVDEGIVGDPLEEASLQAMRWTVSANGKMKPALGTERRKAGNSLKLDSSTVVDAIEIVGRHHFSSKLQRMSCLVRTEGANKQKRLFVVAKGSPEAIGTLLAKKPNGYDDESKRLAKDGYRVIALAYKPIVGGNVEEDLCLSSRTHCESNLKFAGFCAFTCRVRKDTKDVLKRLREGGMSTTMITGDAILTATHVAKEVGICYDPAIMDDEVAKFVKTKKKGSSNKEKRPILFLELNSNGDGLYWKSYDNDCIIEDQFSSEQIPQLAKQYDLATTGKALALALEQDVGTNNVLQHFKIFARMRPDEKETVIECLHHVGLTCLMCGDGANDVGALKQADVGVALLSGFGNANVDKSSDKKSSKKKGSSSGDASNTAVVTAFATKEDMEALRRLPIRTIKSKIREVGADPDDYPDIVEKEDLIQLYRIKSSELAVKRHDMKRKADKAKMTRAEMQAKQRAMVAEKQAKMMERVRELEAAGESFAQVKAMKEFMQQEWSATSKKKAEMQKMNTVEGGAAMIAAQLDDLDSGELPMVKLGDASIAAPFTSKMPSIRSCVDIVRQGRCTLVTSIQMYQILALNCLISSYSLSVLYLDGVKYGDTQMTAMGILGSVSYISVSRSKPLDRLSSVKPLTSIFHPSLFLSLLGQFAAHLVTMYIATRMAKEHLPSDYTNDLDGEFQPGILNSVVFLVSNVQQVTVFVVNLQGRPFMTGLTENTPLLWSLLATFMMTFMFASEHVPSLNKYFQLVPFPSDDFRNTILRLLVVDVVVAFVWDRLMKLIFCPTILFASLKGGWSNQELMRLLKTTSILFFIMYMLLGNEETWNEMLKAEEEAAAAAAAAEQDGADGLLSSPTPPDVLLHEPEMIDMGEL